jgi:hypothetical protein
MTIRTVTDKCKNNISHLSQTVRGKLLANVDLNNPGGFYEKMGLSVWRGRGG